MGNCRRRGSRCCRPRRRRRSSIPDPAARQGGGELPPVPGAVDIEERILQMPGSAATQRSAMRSLPSAQRADRGASPTSSSPRGLALHADDLALAARLLHLAAEQIAAGAVVEFLDVEVLHVEPRLVMPQAMRWLCPTMMPGAPGSATPGRRPGRAPPGASCTRCRAANTPGACRSRAAACPTPCGCPRWPRRWSPAGIAHAAHRVQEIHLGAVALRPACCA
jgi:hypothetical protein